jgi:hypothetical protein
MRYVQKKRPLLVAVDEVDCPLAVLRCQLLLVFAGDLRVNHFLVLDQRQVRPAIQPLFYP